MKRDTNGWKRTAMMIGPLRTMAQRITDLERDVAELREQNLRLAEIADVVQELLVPLASRDQERIDAAIEEFGKGI